MKRTTSTFLSMFLLMSLYCLNAWGGQFKHAVYYAAGQRPYQVVAASFTNSGNLDLAVADYVSDQVCILLGKGDGTFKKLPCFSASLPIAIASGDFNEDGNQDLALLYTSGTGDGSLVIFLGDGTGHFKRHAGYRTGVGSASLTIADFDGAGHLDVAVANKGFNQPGNVMVFFGNGKGGLGNRVTYKTGGAPWAIAAGDLNGDPNPDLAVTNLKGYVSVLLNDGTGHFKKPVNYNAGGGEVVDVKIADLRHDGRNDLVTGNASLSAVGVLLNKVNGTFGAATLYPTHCDVEAVATVDFDLDGRLDAAVAAHIDNSALIYGKGDGTFGQPVPIKDAVGPDGGFSVAAGNFASDRAPDLAIPIENDGKIAILLNTK